jgi:hypothetical protein
MDLALGVAEPPLATPKDRLGVADATPRALGGGSATPSGQTQNNKITKLDMALGGGRTNPWGPKGGFGHP